MSALIEDQTEGAIVTDRKDLTCPACGGTRLQALPVPHTLRSMLSDGRLIGRALEKMACLKCGYGFHRMPPTQDDLRSFFNEDYSLGQRDTVAEKARADGYAVVVSELLQRHAIPPPARLIELGCGMGSLLGILSETWGCAKAVGVEPSAQLIAAACTNQDGSLKMMQGFAEDVAARALGQFDLCLSVNVIEHTLDPVAFLKACAAMTAQGGHVVVICPAAVPPNLELLFYDHISSFTEPALSRMAARAGLCLVDAAPLPGALSEFQGFVLRHGNALQADDLVASDLAKARAAFLQQWSEAPTALEHRLEGQNYVLFGTGEFADLLAAYAPELVAQAEAFVVDWPHSDTFHGKPVISTEVFYAEGDATVVAAVHLRNWNAVQHRFERAGKAIYHPLVAITQ